MLHNLNSRTAKGVASAVSTVGLVVWLATGAFAVDPDGGATSDGFDTVKTFLTGTLAPALFALAIIGIAVFMGLRWLKKGTKSAS